MSLESRVGILLVQPVESDGLFADDGAETEAAPHFAIERCDRLDDVSGALADHRADAALVDLDALGEAPIPRLQVLRGDQPRLPILVIGTRKDPALARRIIRAGADDFLLRSTLNPPLLERVVTHLVERHRREELKDRFNSHLNAIIRQSSDGILIVNRQGVVRFVNPSGAQLFGRDADSFAGCSFGYPLGGEESVEIDIPQGEGKSIIAEMRVAPILWHDEECYVASLRDITERLETRARLERAVRLESIGRLAAGVAHRFNNALTQIHLSADLLTSDRCDGDSLRRRVGVIRHSANQVSEIAQQLLAFAQKQRLTLEKLDLNEVVESMRPLVSFALGDSIRSEFGLEPGLGLLRADRSSLETVLLDLSLNAKEAMPAGGCLSVSTFNVTLSEPLDAVDGVLPPGSYVCLSVSDSGEGMSREAQERAFEPFFSSKSLGSGLGLASVLGTILQCNGNVTLESRLGEGTCITIYLPAWEENGEVRLAQDMD